MEIKDWKRIIEEYDKEKETIIDYCRRLGVTDSCFYYYREKYYGKQVITKEKPKFVPATVKRENKTINFEVNSIALSIDNTVDDDTLKRIINACVNI